MKAKKNVKCKIKVSFLLTNLSITVSKALLINIYQTFNMILRLTILKDSQIGWLNDQNAGDSTLAK